MLGVNDFVHFFFENGTKSKIPSGNYPTFKGLSDLKANLDYLGPYITMHEVYENFKFPANLS